MINRIGILSWHYHQNFGSALQCYALFQTLKSIGKKPIFLNYRNKKGGFLYKFSLGLLVVGSSIEYHIKRLLENLHIVKKGRWQCNAFQFRRKHLKQTCAFNDPIKAQKICHDIDAIICGSDQIWAPNCYDPFYFATFADGKKIRKISYAASIGLNDIPSNLIAKYQHNLKDFYAISVRESEGRELLKNKCGIDSTVVLDPTLLVDVSTYESIERPVLGITSPFIFCYFLNEQHTYRSCVESLAKQKGLQIVGVSANCYDNTYMKCLSNLGADHFLWLIHYAQIVLTDSYHGSIFSILYHKDFWIFQRFQETDPICQNSRIRQLSSHFSIEKQILPFGISHIDRKPDIDFYKIDSQLNALRKTSLTFLKEALK